MTMGVWPFPGRLSLVPIPGCIVHRTTTGYGQVAARLAVSTHDTIAAMNTLCVHVYKLQT